MIQRTFSDDSGSDITVTVDARRVNYRFMRGYTLVAREASRILYTSDMPVAAHAVQLWMWDHITHGNLVTGSTYEQIGDACGQITKSRVCAMIRMLECVNLLRRESPGCIVLNPHYSFRGSPAEQNRALDEWDAKYPTVPQLPMLVPARKKRTRRTRQAALRAPAIG